MKKEKKIKDAARLKLILGERLAFVCTNSVQFFLCPGAARAPAVLHGWNNVRTGATLRLNRRCKPPTFYLSRYGYGIQSVMHVTCGVTISFTFDSAWTEPDVGPSYFVPVMHVVAS